MAVEFLSFLKILIPLGEFFLLGHSAEKLGETPWEMDRETMDKVNRYHMDEDDNGR